MKKIIPVLVRRRVLYFVEALLSIIYIITKYLTSSLSFVSVIFMALGLLILNSVLYRLQKRRVYKRHGRRIKKVVGINIIGKLAQINICFALVFVDASLIKQTTLGRMITGRDIVENTYSVVVMKTNPAHYIENTKNYTFGYMRGYDQLEIKNLADVIAKINVKNDQSIEPSIYETEKETYNALKSGEVKAIIINEADRDHFNEASHDFTKHTRVVKTYVEKTTTEVANKLSGGDKSYGRISVKA